MTHSVKTTMAILLLAGLSVHAQDAPAKKYGWLKEAVGSVNLTQTSFDNWAAGGENSFAWQISVNYKFVNDQEKTNWATSGKMAYGNTKQGDADFRTSSDEIKFESVYKYKLGVWVNPYASFNAETQFAKGYDYSVDPRNQISAFMDPGYFRESFGVGYQQGEMVKTRAGLSFKQTLTRDFPDPYANDPDTPETETTRSEVGLESVTDLNYKFAENTKLTSKLELFSAFQGFEEIDVNWDNILTTKINQYFSMNVNVKLLYDHDISAKRQLKQSMAFGITYSFL